MNSNNETKPKFITKDKVCIFIIGILLGAVVASGAFLIYSNVTKDSQSSQMQGGGTPPNMSEGGTPPSMPDGSTPPEMPDGETPPELPDGEAPSESPNNGSSSSGSNSDNSNSDNSNSDNSNSSDSGTSSSDKPKTRPAKPGSKSNNTGTNAS